MGNLSIIDKLGKSKQEITIAEGKTYEINCGAKTMIEAQELFKKKASFEVMFDVIELLLGKKARKDIYNMDVTVKELNVIIIGVMAQVNEISYEEMEKRFQSKQ